MVGVLPAPDAFVSKIGFHLQHLSPMPLSSTRQLQKGKHYPHMTYDFFSLDEHKNPLESSSRFSGPGVTLTSGIPATVIAHEFRGSLAARETHWRASESTYLCPRPTPDRWIRILTWWESRTQKINKSGLLHAPVTILCHEMKTTILKIVCSRDQHKETQEMKQSAHRYLDACGDWERLHSPSPWGEMNHKISSSSILYNQLPSILYS